MRARYRLVRLGSYRNLRCGMTCGWLVEGCVGCPLEGCGKVAIPLPLGLALPLLIPRPMPLPLPLILSLFAIYKRRKIIPTNVRNLN